MRSLALSWHCIFLPIRSSQLPLHFVCRFAVSSHAKLRTDCFPAPSIPLHSADHLAPPLRDIGEATASANERGHSKRTVLFTIATLFKELIHKFVEIPSCNSAWVETYKTLLPAPDDFVSLTLAGGFSLQGMKIQVISRPLNRMLQASNSKSTHAWTPPAFVAGWQATAWPSPWKLNLMKRWKKYYDVFEHYDKVFETSLFG